MMNGTTDARMPMNMNFFPKWRNAPMAERPVLRPIAVSSSKSDTPNVNTSTR